MITKQEDKDDSPAPVYIPDFRKCLGCGKRFKSKWIGNRLCQSCRVIDPNPGERKKERDAKPAMTNAEAVAFCKDVLNKIHQFSLTARDAKIAARNALDRLNNMKKD